MCQVPVGVGQPGQVAAECICAVVVTVVTGWALTLLVAVYWGELVEEAAMIGIGLALLAGVAFVFQ